MGEWWCLRLGSQLDSGARVYGKIMLSISIKFIAGLCSAARRKRYRLPSRDAI